MGFTEMRALSKAPYNAEPQLAELVKYNITPLPLAYARNHSDIKDLKSDIDTYTIRIGGNVPSEKAITYEDLLRFPRKEVVAALVCAGNRRAKMAESTGREVRGIKWADGAVCNARWAGARLRDVLLTAGLSGEDVDSCAGLHACFASHIAICEDDASYGGSIPLRDALSEEGEVLLAYEMNGEPLPPRHGFPVRVVVPGTYGMRWVKWVDQITISREESPNFYQQRDYKILPDTVLSKEVAEVGGWWSRFPSMQHLACNSVVADLRRLSAACPDDIKLMATGYAYSCCPIARVETSIDGGRTWGAATIKYQEGPWSWTLWETEIEFTLDDDMEDGGIIGVEEDKNGRLRRAVTVLCRAVDSAGSEQNLECKWNLRGVGYSGAGERTLVL